MTEDRIAPPYSVLRSPSSGTKPALRAAALARRDALTPDTRKAASAAIARRVAPILSHPRPQVVGTYWGLGSEADPEAIEAWCAGEGVVIGLATMTDRDTMVFRVHKPGEALAPDAYGVPAPPASAPAVEPDVLIVPVSAFDRSGMRLGKGRGVYDRAIAALGARGRAPLLVGIGFSVQEVAAIPAEPHDVRLDWIVTENQALEFPRGR